MVACESIYRFDPYTCTGRVIPSAASSPRDFRFSSMARLISMHFSCCVSKLWMLLILDNFIMIEFPWPPKKSIKVYKCRIFPCNRHRDTVTCMCRKDGNGKYMFKKSRSSSVGLRMQQSCWKRLCLVAATNHFR